MSYVAVVKGKCPICCADHTHGTPLLLDKRLKDIPDDKVPTEVTLCGECDELANKGLIALVEIDPDKSEIDYANPSEVDLNAAYRTGTYAWFPCDVLNIETKQNMCFVEIGVIEDIQERFKQEMH